MMDVFHFCHLCFHWQDNVILLHIKTPSIKNRWLIYVAPLSQRLLLLIQFDPNTQQRTNRSFNLSWIWEHCVNESSNLPSKIQFVLLHLPLIFFFPISCSFNEPYRILNTTSTINQSTKSEKQNCFLKVPASVFHWRAPTHFLCSLFFFFFERFLVLLSKFIKYKYKISPWIYSGFCFIFIWRSNFKYRKWMYVRMDVGDVRWRS